MRVIVKVVVSLILVFLILGGTYVLLDETVFPISKASFDNMTWNATMTIVESDGAGDNVVFGEASNASDDQDEYDLPKPPFPPQLPYLVAWFDTNLENPYNKLWYEYKQSSDEYKEWDLSIMWMPEPGGKSSTDIDISWGSSRMSESGYGYVLLYKNDKVVSDMIKENSYTFNSLGGTLNNFRIVCQNEITDTTSKNYSTSFISMVFVFIIAIMIAFALYWKKKN